MTFREPVMLAGLLLIPFAALAYLSIQRRRRREAATGGPLPLRLARRLEAPPGVFPPRRSQGMRTIRAVLGTPFSSMAKSIHGPGMSCPVAAAGSASW